MRLHGGPGPSGLCRFQTSVLAWAVAQALPAIVGAKQPQNASAKQSRSRLGELAPAAGAGPAGRGRSAHSPRAASAPRPRALADRPAPGMASAIEVESADVVRLVMQFLKEQGLGRSLSALQEETDVALNTVDSIEGFVADVASGRWDAVLQQTATLKLAPEKLMALYEQIVRELAELRELATARELMRSAVALRLLKQTAPARFAHLELLLKAPAFDVRDAYPDGSNKERKRADVAAMLAEDLSVVPPGRLLTLLGQAVKWQRHTGRLPLGSRLDVFRNAPPARKEEDDLPTTLSAGAVSFGSDSRPTSVAFSADGAHVITGSHDGFVEVWDAETGALDTRLAYQSSDELMMHEDSVLCLATSDDGAVLATGCKDGGIKVWDLAAGTCLRRFPGAHVGGVSSLSFTRDGTQLLSAGSDSVARIHGLRSGKTIKEFRGHASFVHAAAFAVDGGQVVTGSADGTARVWSMATSDCVATLTPPQSSATASAPIIALAVLRRRSDEVLLLPRGPSVFLMTFAGAVVREIRSPGGTMTAMAPSPRSALVHVLTDDRQLRCFDLESGEEASAAAAASEGDVLGLAQHPRRNRIATFGSACGVRLWSARAAAAAHHGASASSAGAATATAAATATGAAAAAPSDFVSTAGGVTITSGDTL